MKKGGDLAQLQPRRCRRSRRTKKCARQRPTLRCGDRCFSGRTGKEWRRFLISSAKSAKRNPHAAHRRFDRGSAGEHRPRRYLKAHKISRTRHFGRLAHRPARVLAAAERDASHPAHSPQHSRRARPDQLTPLKTRPQHHRPVPQDQSTRSATSFSTSIPKFPKRRSRYSKT